MSNDKFAVEKLVTDDYFRKWVQGKLPREDNFWESWLAEAPERKDLVNCARFVINALNMEHEVLGEQRMMESVRKIMTEADKEKRKESARFINLGWKIAATLILATGLLWYFDRADAPAGRFYGTIAETAGIKTIEKINNANTPLTVILSDGSSITLQPGSRLSYPEEFGTDKREVILSGEGFFDIAPHPSRPFLVYANEIVTKVLGTSFHIKAYENDADVTVKVVTGKVSVLASKPSKESRIGPVNDGLILSPNQMAVYSRNPEKLTRSLVENPGIIKTSSKKSSDYNFENTPVGEVFKALEEGYGVPIVYNAEQLASCTVTAPLENETLYDKLDMICKVIRASYEIVDAQVIITSKGCE